MDEPDTVPASDKADRLAPPVKGPSASAVKDPARSARQLAIVTLGSLLLAGGVIALVLGRMSDPSWSAYGWAMGIMLFASIASLAPMLLTMRHGTEALMAGYFIAMTIRVLVSLVLGIVAVKFGCPSWPLAIEGLTLYGVLLAAETTVLARLMWNARL